MGAGGTISYLLDKGAMVYYAAFSTAEESVPAHMPKDILKPEVKNTTQKLGIKKDNLFIYNYQVRKLNYHRQGILEDMIKLRNCEDFNPILMPSMNDIQIGCKYAEAFEVVRWII